MVHYSGRPRDPQQHTLIQKRIPKELLNFQELEKLNPQDDPESRRHFLTNFDRTDSTLQLDEIARIEDLLVEFHDIFARHRFDLGVNEKFMVKLTPKDNSPAYSQSLPTPINLKEVFHDKLLLTQLLMHQQQIRLRLLLKSLPNILFCQQFR